MERDPSESEAGFAGLGLRAELLRALTNLGYEEPTPIQQGAIPPLIAGDDLVGQAATGTGKTAAFALPLLQGLVPAGRDAGPSALVLVPTRELAEQVSQAVHRYGRDLGVRVLPVYGGQPIGRQLQVLNRGVDVVVGTPGRVLDHIERETLRLGDIRTVVLDEADEMLDMGFAEDIEAILAETPESRQTVLFSATMPPRIDGIARRHLRNPTRITMGRKAVEPGELPLVRQSAYVVARAHRAAALGRILDVETPTAAIVFCRTREEVDQVTETLNGRGYRAEALHGGMSQDQRDRVMGRLRGGSTELLVATDVAARGLDVEQLTHVINFNVPVAPEAYVHRIGRVGRAGREGCAITLAEPREQRMLKAIERLTGQRITLEKLPTVTDLRARRLEVTRTALQACLEGDDLERFRVVLDSLTDEFDVENVALAAVKLLHEAAGGDRDEDEIPTPSLPPEGRRAPARDNRAPGGKVARLFFGVGRRAGVRPQDLVGAIAGEAGLNSRDIGAIQITDRFSLVEVPEQTADRVIAAMQRATIRGRRPTVRRERFAR
ncbi:ATP-dependent RNA helicase DeaD [Actinoplanes campanulatus]|uniref:RNA helicase n=1 Tax=Actinoplanes campanulatus TaxID=113559 RepID=A0A7W5AKI1_9ACTN|nr:DEAD/DEAH box helicase [Actinoplanes campanulatus]MBB3097953.1 ATP-dependent RNA helicase DeaD [Actinoplanes campanulatus]GGN31573.1 DEAD-box ATP-dependent RNA helicase CshA [Actinoplanes campanulatus]GID41339.1 DEAD-box ATP-dependent RNA helicase CshA [Actinoplanes campanulatus]